MARIGYGISLLAFTVALATTAACKKKNAEPGAGSGSGTTGSAETGSASGSATGSASGSATGSAAGSDTGSAAGSGSDAGSAGSGASAGSAAPDGSTAMTNKGGNCPSLVSGATTTAKVEKDVVVVSITSTDKDAVAAIHKRAAALIKEKADSTGRTGGGGHDQKGTHGGAGGICPIYFSDGTGAATNDTNGTIVRMVPRAGTAAELKQKIDDRIAKSAEWVKANVKDGEQGTTGGVGGGEGKHGSVHAGSGDGHGKDRKDAAAAGSAGSGATK